MLTLVCTLVACGWVDSTGRGSNSAPVAQISFADGQQTDATALNESSSVRLTVSGSDVDGQISRIQWRPEPIEQGALDQCAAVPNFDINLAANSLDSACSDPDSCEFSFEVQNEAQNDVGEDEVEFVINVPTLSAPVGVTYQLDAIDNEGGTGTQRSTFCLIAINEAPDAVDDMFTVLEGQVLSVSADSGQVHLLTNDVQDDHVSNSALSVLPIPEQAPMLASAFSLESNGGFTYAASPIADRGAASEVDTFVYSVTDGTHVSNATVTVNVVARNDPPVQTAPIPLQEIIAGVDFSIDLSTFFSDAEGSTLSFAITSGALPASGSLTLSATGELAGTAESIDEGNYIINVIASDGSEQVIAEVSIVIVENLPVVPRAIAAQQNELGETLELNLSEFFTDPEAQPLTYSLDNPPSTATFDLDELTGELAVIFTEEDRYIIDVSADDGINTPVSIRFVVVVTSDNIAPVFRGTVTNRTARVGTAITSTPVAALFTDADDDVLTFSVTGPLPDGLVLSAAGVLSGTPTQAGTFTAIRIVATDPLGKSAQSNPFLIRVLAALVVATPSSPSPEAD